MVIRFFTPGTIAIGTSKKLESIIALVKQIRAAREDSSLRIVLLDAIILMATQAKENELEMQKYPHGKPPPIPRNGLQT